MRKLRHPATSPNTVTIWGVTSTVSGSGDQGADPNKLVMITDSLANTSAALAATESFSTIKSANSAEVLRRVSPAPGSLSGSPE